MKAITAQQLARNAALRYVCSEEKGYWRQKKGRKFIYRNNAGKEIKSKVILERIRSLVLPPAWGQVWICAHPNGHLQATGIDARGRKQYRYHTHWSKVRSTQKFGRLLDFGKKLPTLRKQMRKDLRGSALTKDKVIALALSIMEETAIRVGNTYYEKENGSHGLTTLKNKHINISGNTTFFRFKGKKGIQQSITLKATPLIRLLKKVKELPGQELFQYYDENQNIHKLESGDINDYLKRYMDATFTCKDIRTWKGSVTALQLMAALAGDPANTDRKKNTPQLLKDVACKLGNTVAVCRKYYIHPALLNTFESGELDQLLLPAVQQKTTLGSAEAEKMLLSFLKSLPAEK